MKVVFQKLISVAFRLVDQNGTNVSKKQGDISSCEDKVQQFWFSYLMTIFYFNESTLPQMDFRTQL